MNSLFYIPHFPPRMLLASFILIGSLLIRSLEENSLSRDGPRYCTLLGTVCHGKVAIIRTLSHMKFTVPWNLSGQPLHYNVGALDDLNG